MSWPGGVAGFGRGQLKGARQGNETVVVGRPAGSSPVRSAFSVQRGIRISFLCRLPPGHVMLSQA